MKKSNYRIIIVAIVMIIVGLVLFLGGMIAAGGVSAVRDVMRNGIGQNHVYEYEFGKNRFNVEIDEDGFDIDLDVIEF